MSVGEQAPDFEAESTTGKIRLSSLRGRRVVLYFYPKSFTSGCTNELKRFVELYDEFKASNAEVIGVSVDSLDTQVKFASRYGARFPLVSDRDKTISKAYGVLRGSTAQRVTFIIDENGTIMDRISGLKNASDHADEALKRIKPATAR
ncbi:peroxiredoxin [Thermocladium modestius]|uniref:thioredoxin-dependent peroxiredoxin n=1 Tax=Thermocladium modestius TaxID=62609 RepID=A0A830GVW7_9CREN|nr:peroxiredoxin [Thermocladium modestius]